VPLTGITEAVHARVLSGQRALRAEAEKKLPRKSAAGGEPQPSDIDAIRDALYASKIIAYAQGFEQMTAASKEYAWDLRLGEVATIWRGGCIIRARFLDRIVAAYKAEGTIPNLVLQDYFRNAVLKAESSWRQVVGLAVEHGVAIPAFSSSLSYYDGLRRSRGPANLLQGLRDYFGAHTYRRLDAEGSFHTRWSQDGKEVAVK
jgi:6-phosphogluconate dehydrogenase